MGNVFVYGSLKAGGRLNGYLIGNGCRLVEAREIKGFRMVEVPHAWFPTLVPDAGATVKGEVWELPADPAKEKDTIRQLDWVEGVPSLYVRRKVDAADDQSPWIYVWAKPKEAMAWVSVPDGFWDVERTTPVGETRRERADNPQ
jgi:gamma-glutamylcyclotransferase (GGCT)/AIG2-like uncharacterized protein YtfP